MTIVADMPSQTRKGDHLSSRQVQFIALGGAIGAGLFLGSGMGIAKAGPAVLLSYAFSGVLIFLVARALGEMAVERPIGGSFTVYAEEYIGRWAGYATGWCYWLTWVLVGTAELIAIGMFVRFWFPAVPVWAPGLVALPVLLILNAATIRLFGEIEFWLALIKVLAILLLIGAGLTIIALHLGPSGLEGWQTFHGHGGFAPHGGFAVVTSIPIAIFAFGGVEMIGLTAAQAEDIERTVPKAINGIVVRILLFYVGSLAVIMMLMPWNTIAPGQSPYVLAFERIGIPGAASLVNIVVLSAVISSCNSGLFATGRVLASLAERGHAPGFLAGVDGRGQPRRALVASAMALLLVFGAGLFVPATFFAALMSMVAFLLLFAWAIICVSHLIHRKRFGRGRFPMPFSPSANIIVLTVIALIALAMAASPGNRGVLCCVLLWISLLTSIWFGTHYRDRV